MQTNITLHSTDRQVTTVSLPSGGVRVAESANPWLISSIWRAAYDSLGRRDEGLNDGPFPVCGAQMGVDITFGQPVVLVDPLCRRGTVGDFFGITPLLLSLYGALGGWACPECGESVSRDSLSRISMRLSQCGHGNAICAVPRPSDAPPLPEFATFFEATRVVRDGRLFLVGDRTLEEDRSIGRDAVVVSSRGLPLIQPEGEMWLREQARLHPFRIDVGIARGGSSDVEWVGIIGSTAQCQRCGLSSAPPTTRDLRRIIAGQQDGSGITLLQSPLSRIGEGSLRGAAALIEGLLRSGEIEGLDEAFLRVISTEDDSTLEVPLLTPLATLSAGGFIRLAFARLRAGRVSGVQVVINQLNASDISNICSDRLFVSQAQSVGSVMFLGRGGDYEGLQICEVSGGCHRSSDKVPIEDDFGGKLDQLTPGSFSKIYLDENSLTSITPLEKAVLRSIQKSPDKGTLVRCYATDILADEGEVGETTGLDPLIAELAARLPESRRLGLSPRDIAEGMKGSRSFPALFGIRIDELRTVSLEQLMYRLPQVGYAYRGIESIIRAGGGQVSLSEDVRGHPPGLRVLYRLIRSLPLRGRVVMIHNVGWLLSARQAEVIEQLLKEELVDEQRRSGGRVVWFDSGE